MLRFRGKNITFMVLVKNTFYCFGVIFQSILVGKYSFTAFVEKYNSTILPRNIILLFWRKIVILRFYGKITDLAEP